eukprot:6480457-Alexandrium_andersonii.AAC.1
MVEKVDDACGDSIGQGLRTRCARKMGKVDKEGRQGGQTKRKMIQGTRTSRWTGWKRRTNKVRTDAGNV